MTPLASKRGLLLGWLLVQERVNSCLRVGDDQPLLFGAALTFGGFTRLGHRVLSSIWFRFRDILVPQPGFGPGRPWPVKRLQTAPVCLFSTGGPGENSGGGGGGRTLNQSLSRRLLYPIELHPHCEGISADGDALNPFSKRNVVVSDPSVGVVGLYVLVIDARSLAHLSHDLAGAIVGEPTQNFVNRRHRGAVPGKIEALAANGVAHFGCRHRSGGLLKHVPDRVRDPKAGKVVPHGNASQRSEVIQDLVEMAELGIDIAQLRLQNGAPVHQRRLLFVDFLPPFCVIALLHNQGGYHVCSRMQ